MTSGISTAALQVAGRELNVAAPSTYQMVSVMRYVLSWEIFRRDYAEFMDGKMIDVGASIGAYALMVALAFPEAEILCIEPSKYNYPFLEYNTKAFPNIQRVKAAASSNVGGLTIGLPKARENASFEEKSNTGWISAHGYGETLKERVDTIPVDSVSLDASLIKIDVEGHEAHVLEGMDTTLSERRPAVLMEVKEINRMRTESSNEDLIKRMAHYQYASFPKKGYDDFLFLPS